MNSIQIPSLQDFPLKEYPALSVGIVPFTFLLLITDGLCGGWLSHKFSLYPLAPFKLDLNRVSFYLLYHQGFIHWLFNIIALVGPLHHFERSHGTVFTGVTLNLLAVTAAIQYCIVGVVLYRNTHVIGLSGVVFSFITYYSLKEHDFRPVVFSSGNVNIPTKYSPFITLAIVTILMPGSSFFGHLAGISSGYLLAYDKLKILYPPSSIIVTIESKLAKLIGLLDGVVDFIGEQDAIDIRTVAYKPIFSGDSEADVAFTSATDAPAVNSFRGEGQVLGA